MKDRGHIWIGELPSTWKLRRFKDAGRFQTGRDHKELRAGNVPVFGSSCEPFAMVDRPLCRRKAIAIGRKGTVDRPFVIQPDFWAVDTCMFHTVPRKDYSLEYLGYWSNIVPWQEIATQTALPSLTQTDANNVIVGCPPLDEQRRIAAWLDIQTNRIDKRLALLSKKRELLIGLRLAVITEGVCVGVDREAELQDSGIPEIGAVPNHWKVVRIKQLASKIGSGKTPLGGSSVYVDAGVAFLRSQNIWDEGLRLEDVVYISDEVDRAMRTTRVKPKDILFNITGGSIGRSVLVPDKFPQANVSQHVCIIRLRSKRLAEFVALAMLTQSTKRQVAIEQVGAARDGLNFDQIGRLAIPFPPKEAERQRIIDFVKSKVCHIDHQIRLLDQLEALLAEVRKAVIHEAVTGKIDLSAYEPPTQAA